MHIYVSVDVNEALDEIDNHTLIQYFIDNPELIDELDQAQKDHERT